MQNEDEPEIGCACFLLLAVGKQDDLADCAISMEKFYLKPKTLHLTLVVCMQTAQAPGG